MILHDYWRSSASYRLRIARGPLNESWETVSVDLTQGMQIGTNHLALNPQGLVHVLEIDGAVLTQSLAIIEYLNETRRAGFLPDDGIGRARVRAMAYAIAMEIHPVCNLRVMRHAVTASGNQISAEDWMQAFIAPGLLAVEALMTSAGAGRFCYGDQVSIADICLVPQFYNADCWGVSLAAMPSIRAVRAALEELPAFINARPENTRRATGP